MARNGSGTYSNPYPNFVSGTVISSNEVDANNSDIATALTQSIAVDGQSVVTGDIPLATHKFTAMKVGTAATDSLSLGQAQAEAFVWCGTAGGSADAITLSPSPAITAYAAGQRFVWMASGSTNTGATTVAISGLSTIALQDNGAALTAGQHAAGKMFMGILNTASTMQIMQVQVSGTDPLIISSLTVNGNSQFNGTVTVGVDDTGYDVKFFGDTASAYMLWDASTDDLVLAGAAGIDLAGDLDVDGTTNLDAVDIDGAVQIDSTVTVGVDDTGYDVKFFGDTASAYMLWDTSTDDLVLAGDAGIDLAGDIDVDGTANLDAVDIDGAVQIDNTVTVGVDDTGYDVKFFGDTASAYMLWDTSTDDLVLAGAAGLVIPDGGTIGSASDTDAMAIDANGIITKSAQPAFQAVPASNQNNIPINADTTVVWGTERFDTNADFASNTFTAPVTGKYQLNVELWLQNADTATQYYQLRLKTSNYTYYGTMPASSFTADVGNFVLAINVLADMDASDTAFVTLFTINSGTAQADISTISTFSGALIA